MERTMANDAATSRTVIPTGRSNFSLSRLFLSLPSISSSLDILISAYFQFSRSRAVKPCQALSGPVKHFSRKKIFFHENSTRCLNRLTLRLRTTDCGLRTCPPAIPNPKSTLLYPKSTVDLGCEGLIWVKNGLISCLFKVSGIHFSQERCGNRENQAERRPPQIKKFIFRGLIQVVRFFQFLLILDCFLHERWSRVKLIQNLLKTSRKMRQEYAS
jgi:hypothetical protein